MTDWKFTCGEMFAENAADGSANEFASDGFSAFEFTFIFQFEFAGDGGEGSVEIGDAGHSELFTSAGRALLGTADDILQRGDGKALADTGTLIDALVFAGLECNFLNDFTKIIGHFHGDRNLRDQSRLPAR